MATPGAQKQPPQSLSRRGFSSWKAMYAFPLYTYIEFPFGNPLRGWSSEEDCSPSSRAPLAPDE